MKLDSTYDLGTVWRSYNTDGRGRHSRTKGNVSFQYQTLYSRQTPVAKFYKNKLGVPFILVQEREYSYTTNRHVDKCVRHFKPSFRVPNIGAQGGWSREKWMEPKEMHAANVEYLIGIVRKFEAAAVKGWLSDHYPLSDIYWQQHLIELHDRVFLYAYHADVEVQMESITVIGTRIEKAREAKKEAYQHPAQVAKRERARVRRLAKKALGL
jgi:hypothetical protein